MQEIKLYLNNKEFKIRQNESENNKIYVNDNEFNISILKQQSLSDFSYLANNSIYQVEFENNNANDTQISIDGLIFDINITNEKQQFLDSLIKKSQKNIIAQNVKIKAPMPGIIVKINVVDDQKVEKGDKLLILEAMKMENAILSPVAGTIKNIKAMENKPIEKEALILEIEI